MRTSTVNRKTAETDISLTLNLDGSGVSAIDSGCGFLDHMLTLLSRHGGFDLTVYCKGDRDVDYHHTTEDIGIALGAAFAKALGEKVGIVRYGHIILPMDESLVLSAVDLSGRCYYLSDFDIKASKVGDFDTELVDEFFAAFAANAACNLHIRQLAGTNAHHIIEAAFKAVARSLRMAVGIDERFKDKVPSTKGVL